MTQGPTNYSQAEVTHTNLRGNHEVDHGDYNSSDDDKAIRREEEKV